VGIVSNFNDAHTFVDFAKQFLDRSAS